MKKSIKDTKKDIKQVSVKQAKSIYLSVLLLIVAIFGTGIYYLTNMNNGNNTVQEQNYLTADVDEDTEKDTDGDGYLDSEDSDPQNWNVGDRDLLMFATLAYEPANSDNLDDNTKIIKYNDKGQPIYNINGSFEYNTVSKLKRVNGKPGFDYVCPDAKRNDLAGNCMIKEQQMIGMQSQSYNFFGGIIFNKWEEIGRDFYFAGLNNNDELEYYASVDEVKQWAIVDYVSYKTKEVFNNNRKFEATTFRLDNNIVIAFRGTDFPDLMEWLADAGYVRNDLGEYEKEAEKYVIDIINRFTEEYENELEAAEKNKTELPKAPKFYITGHSLGAYLSQVAALKVLTSDDCKGKDYLEDVVYFNGMGLNFNVLSKKQKDFTKLERWATNEYGKGTGKTHRLICYNINGDPVSALGKHLEQIGFYASPGAVRRHMQDSAILQLATRKPIIQLLTSTVLNKAGIFTNGRLDEVGKYFDYYNNLYGQNKKISILDLVWFAHEPSAGLFYNIKQGIRGGEETLRVTKSISKSTILKTIIDLKAEATGEVTSYQWYKNGIAIKGATSDTYQITRNIGQKAELSDKYSVKVIIKTNETNKPEKRSKDLSYNINLNNKGPTGDITSSTWQVKRKNTIKVQLICMDTDGFSDNYITKNDIKVSGLINNLIVESVSGPVMTTKGSVATWTVTLKGNIIGLSRISLKRDSVADIYGNYNNEITSKLIKVTLF